MRITLERALANRGGVFSSPPPRWVAPAGVALCLPKVSWLTFRRTFSSWSHERGVPSKVTAELMGHARVDMTLNTYTQVMPDALEEAVSKMSEELFTIVHSPAGTSALTHCKGWLLR